MKKAIFLDRDGVLNYERGEYTYQLKNFILEPQVPEALLLLKDLGFLLIVVTNQGGISKGLYDAEAIEACHQYLQEKCKYIIDDLFYCPYHPEQSASLTRKPDSLMLERAMGLYQISKADSWMVGNSASDIACGRKVGVHTIRIDAVNDPQADYTASSLWEAVPYITKKANL